MTMTSTMVSNDLQHANRPPVDYANPAGQAMAMNERPRNQVLAMLPRDVWQRLSPFLRRGLLIPGQHLDQCSEPVSRVYFPNSGLISLVMDANDGTQVEVGVIGREGISGVLAVLGGRSPFSRTVVQVAGNAYWIPASILQAEFKRGGALQDWLLRYMQVLTAQSAQCALCNRLHSVEERLSRWLLTVRDRIESNEIDITHEFIAHMLGARRSGVTVALGVLQQAGLIDLSRGHITIQNSAHLENSACECYRLLHTQFGGLAQMGFPTSALKND